MRGVSLVFCLIGWLLVSCSKSTEYRLWGKWQLREVVSPTGVEQVDTVWYNFQNSLFLFQVYRPQSDSMQYCYGYNTVTNETEIQLDLISNPKPVAQFLPYTDWEDRQRTFRIDKLTGSELILSDEEQTYRFRKF